MIIENKYEREIQYNNGVTEIRESVISGEVDKKKCGVSKRETKVNIDFYDRAKIATSRDLKALKEEFDNMSAFCKEKNKLFLATVTQEVREVWWDNKKWKTDLKNIVRIVSIFNNANCQYRDVPYSSDNKQLKESLKNALKEMSINTFSSYEESMNGKMDVILAPKAAAYFVHEILGHPLEFDLIKMNKSVYKEKNLGEKIMPDFFNVSECPENTKELGITYGNYDDDGKPLKNLEIIKNGIFVSPVLYNRCSEMKNESINRMHNFILKPREGGDSLDDIIERSYNALVVDEVLYGYYNIVSGKFVLCCGNTRRVKNGKIISNYFGIHIENDMLSFKNSVKEIGGDFKANLGYCSKNDQLITVGMGAPTVVIADMNIMSGGTLGGF